MGHTGAYIINSFLPVHPHIGGAYMGRPAKIYVKNGSSPHTWGIRKKSWNRGFLQRFIPTYVGHTPSAVVFRCMASVHPHLRGAYSLRTYSDVHLHGSSPHTWGILSSYIFRCSPPRFIPTYVGHTLDRRKKNGWFQPFFLKFYTKKLFCTRSSVFRCYRGRSIPNP